jgi:hypothetical protein
VDKLTSTPITCPVIQDASSVKRKAAIAAISPGSPNRLSGCVCSNVSRPRIKGFERGVSFREGAMQLTLISGRVRLLKNEPLLECVSILSFYCSENGTNDSWHKNTFLINSEEGVFN